MKLTKKLEAEVLKAYNECWMAYLKGDLKTHASYLSEKFKIIGTSEGEQYESKKEWISYCKKTINQFAGIIQKRKNNIKLLPSAEGVMVVENAHLYVLIDDDWTFYSKIRISALLQKEKTGWKYIHQHGSFPDGRANEDEPIASEQIKAENLQLRDAVKRRTTELENKNRELEIEASLERVRVRSMAMQKSDELVEASDIMFDELNKLKVETIRVGIGIIDTVNDKAEIWSRFEKNKKIEDKVRGIVPAGVSVAFDNMLKSKKEKKPYTIVTLKGIEVKKHYQSLSGYLSYQPQKIYNKKESIHSFYFSEGSLNVVSHEPLNEEECNIMLRFAKVFGQMYRRFLDLKNAEAQAREAQIEAALERVRSQSMAMRTSEELKNVVKELRKQIGLLGQKELDTCVIQLYDESPDYIHGWASMTPSESNDEIRDFYARIPKKGLLIQEEALQAYSSGRKDYVLFNEKRKLKQWIDFIKKNYPDAYSVFISTYHGVKPEHVPSYWSFSDFNGGSLLMVTLAPPSDVSRALLKRFANVFGLAYRRFVDIKQAEAQAREAQIQLALERVRARTMAMQRSHELNEVVHELYLQIRSLNFQYGACTIVIMNKNSADMEHWLAGFEQEKYPERYPVKNIHHWLHDAQISAWKKAEKFATFEVEGDEIKAYADLMFTQTGYKNLPKEEKKRLRSQDFVVFNMAYMSCGALMWAPARLTDEQAKILERFANVFDQTYTRFLDIQKAETQVRDSQIELALERVRARTMAMQRSDELREAVLVIYEQLQQLNFESKACNIIIIDKESGSAQYWVSGFSQEIFPESYTVPYLNHPYHDALLKPWKQGDKYVVYEYTGRMKQSFDKLFFTKTEFRNAPEDAKKVMIGLKSVMLSTAFISYGAIQALGAEPLSEENANILQRFAKVFEQTYTRFLDLQKAEAQARESQIQLALERVRARTMAMQKSDELRDAASLLFKQLEGLGVTSWSSGFNIWQDDGRSATINMCNPDGSIATAYHLPHTEDIFFIKICEARQSHEDLLVMETGGKELEDTYNYMFSLPEVKKMLGGMEDTGFQIPKFQVTHCAFFSHGYLMFITYEPVPEMWDVFKRFAKVFEQTYTRFLDLQKAEAQAREAKIEAALEKVRSRTMAMQRSDELSEAASLLFRQVQSLGATQWTAGYCIFDEDKRAITLWMSGPWGDIQPSFRAPLDENPSFINYLEAHNKGLEMYIEENSAKVNEENYQYLLTLPVVGERLNSIIAKGLPLPTYQVDHCAYFSKGFLLFITYQQVPELHSVFKRFAAVFDQTYTRFLDLQKAETQARESQIQLALERVRARTMAMQRSDELADVAQLLFQQVKDLGITAWTAGFNVWQPDNDAYIDWVTDPTGVLLEPYTVPLTGHPTFRAVREARLRGDDFFVSYLEGEQIIETYQLLSSYGDKGQFQKILDSGIPFPTRQFNHFVFGAQVSLLFITYEPCPEAHDIFKRFGKVFEQTYTRFLDLQKAEAQVREAKIEAALEKVRSRSLAMHKSDEIEQVLHALYERLKELDIDFYTAIIILFEKGSKDVVWWLESKANHPFLRSLIPYTDISYFRNLFEARQNGTELISDCYPFEEKNKLFHHLFDHTDLKYTPEEQKKFLLETEFATMAVALAKNTAIHLTSYSRTSFSEQDHDVLKRFAKVFEQAYTRFLDLQKAEAQAREAQIEVALERTRTQSMIMQHSIELDDTLRVFHEQVLLLGINSAFSYLWLPDEEKDRHIFWAAWKEKLPPEDSGGQAGLPAGQAGKNSPTVFKSKAINYPLDRNEPATAQCLVDWKSNEPVYSYHVAPGAVENYFAAWQELLDGVEHLKPGYFSGGLRYVEAFMKYGCFGVMVPADLTAIEKKILGRFAIEFERTYTRFLDLQKSEAQAREAQIEAALERVRSRSMGMQKSEELKEVIQVVYEQFVHLNIKIEHTGFVIDYKTRDDYNIWIADPLGVPSQVIVPYFDSVYYNRFNEAKKNGEDFFATNLSFEEKNKFYQKLFEYVPGLPDEAKKFYFSCPGLAASTVLLDNVCLYIENFSGTPYSDEDNSTLMRFGKVFQQTYTRFNDLQKAEEQAREAKIEAALEKVRSRTMAMQHSNELQDTALLLFQQILALGVSQLGCGFNIWDEDRKAFTSWMAGGLGENTLVPAFKVPSSDDIFLHIREAAEKGELLFVSEQSGEELETHYKYMFSLPIWKDIMAGFTPPTFQVMHCAYFSQGFLMFVSREPVPQAHDIFKRFAKVFEQTYTRFLDLQKAEAQAREAKIEAALEKVRSRTMAMQRSAELAEVATVLFQQVKALGVYQWTCGFGIFEIDDKEFTWYQGSEDGNVLPPCQIPLTEHPVFISFNESRKRGDELYVYEKTGELQRDHYRYMCSLPVLGKLMQDRLDAGKQFPTFQIDHVASFSHGNLVFITYEPVPEMHDVFKRFAKVFDQTYTRFLDLQKSEEQAREAKIEAALERVRSRTMAMQRSEELAEVATVLFQQVKALGVPQWVCGFSIFEIDDKEYTWYSGSAEADILPPVKVPLTEHPVFIQFIESRKRGDELYVYEKTGEYQADHYRYMQSLPGMGERLQKMLDAGFTIPTFQIDHVANFSHGNLLFITYEHFPEMHDVFKRFAKVFDQTYTRFLDLQKAEAQARDAVKQASVDRVRAEIASMRTTNDLERITPLIWNELTTLGVPFIRCGVFIMDEEQQLVQSFLSTPDGKAIAAFRQPYNSPGAIAQVVEHWHTKKMYKQHWNEAQFIEFTKNLVQQGAVISGEKYLTENRPTDLYLHFIPFLQGMLYAGSTCALSDDELGLMQNLADAFSTAYARYEDFNKLEAAKETVEQTLVDLKQAQQQLVQSEKMASLGELTAGIAHEIQNPLNFVNNFSEVNRELLSEMKAEIEKGNIEEVKAIANDIIGNEEKINHHGKRADAIVKGMLQHSRTSSGQKEPTDINALCDEYLRLAYHGLRAKDKSFNAKFETNLDKGIGKINIIPQDIGRVLVNLINNAFYAVNEKQKKNGHGYEPSVTVTSKKDDDGIELSVTDNGNGIPQKVLDKIFQPFFTTKPTGQGTGLGLSLAYDIIKTHNGEIKVESTEREGTTFTIRLPENS